jgi:hypothetical protein
VREDIDSIRHQQASILQMVYMRSNAKAVGEQTFQNGLSEIVVFDGKIEGCFAKFGNR